MKHTLGTAANATGVSKSTIYRAVKSGKLSASRNEDGEYEIDPAELHRVYEPVAQRVETGEVTRHATPDETGDHRAVKPEEESLTRWMRDLVDEQRRQIQEKDEIIQDQVRAMEEKDNAWRKRLDSLEQKLLPAPEPDIELTLDPEPERRGFWGRVFG